MTHSITPMGEEALRHLAALIRIDTTNPPGNETPAAEYLAEVLVAAGLEPTLLGAEPTRHNVVARLKGDQSRAPLLLHAHLDVVPAERARWRHDPFGGEIHDGYLWGRGAIDMKQMAVMCALTLARLKREGVSLKRDVIFAGVADEEAGCDLGSKWLVETHPDLVRAEYALGEAGGFTVHMNGAQLYPIGVAEKGVVWLKATMHGTPGHGSQPRDDNALSRLGAFIQRLGTTRLPQHRTAVVDAYLRAIAKTQRFPLNVMVSKLHLPALAEQLLKRLPDRGVANALGAALSNTAVPTMLRAGEKVNVIPSSATAYIDGRTLPGESSAGLLRELHALAEGPVTFEILKEMPPVEARTDTPLWAVIGDVMRERCPEGTLVPMLMPGFTDAKQWSRLGTQCYGFMPTRFPDDGTRFSDLFHGHDERIPVAGYAWGVEVFYETVRRFATT